MDQPAAIPAEAAGHAAAASPLSNISRMIWSSAGDAVADCFAYFRTGKFLPKLANAQPTEIATATAHAAPTGPQSRE